MHLVLQVPEFLLQLLNLPSVPHISHSYAHSADHAVAFLALDLLEQV